MTSQKVQIFALGIIAGCPTALLEISYFFALILLFLLLFQNSHVMYDSGSCYILLSNSGTNGYTLVCGVEFLKREWWMEGKSSKWRYGPKKNFFCFSTHRVCEKGEERYWLFRQKPLQLPDWCWWTCPTFSHKASLTRMASKNDMKLA